ncbi:MAG: 30S ribosomal protein S9 [bacterium]
MVTKKISAKKIEAEKPGKYFGATGRRKTATARVRIFTKNGKFFLVNKKPAEKYFSTLELQRVVKAALEKMDCLDKFSVEALVRGGGLHAQAEAIRHGLARALVLFDASFRPQLKRAGYLKRDPRMRERKKFGLKRARRAPQFSKR